MTILVAGLFLVFGLVQLFWLFSSRCLTESPLWFWAPGELRGSGADAAGPSLLGGAPPELGEPVPGIQRAGCKLGAELGCQKRTQ